ncbi:ADP-ribose pyrophosphatase [Nocardioides daedukensis]|uniref:ADP-ribose pyrophosphatase n=1 Tax=Nocardioides daedukensis TaxID=634462 RepID=A0A7Y9S0Y8_9ACTN|nr:NUDIX hydrolase [Nocardioides daedukensis]NYG57485.1 ADP-ribose pyrophosphatase [Nocardioides daedukensis]
MSQLADRSESWPVVASTDLHRDGWVVAFRSDQVTTPQDPEGQSFRRLVMEHPGAAMVLAIDEDERVFCLKQYRHPAQTRFVELPAGICDHPGEDPLDVAIRELREEAELEATEWHHLLSVWASPGVSEERHHFYLARGLTRTDRGDFLLEHEEADMETLWVPLDELREAILDGRVTDGPVALAVLAHDARFGTR